MKHADLHKLRVFTNSQKRTFKNRFTVRECPLTQKEITSLLKTNRIKIVGKSGKFNVYETL